MATEAITAGFTNWPEAAKLGALHGLLRDSGAVAEALRLMQMALDSEPGLSSIDWGYVESRYTELARDMPGIKSADIVDGQLWVTR